MTDAVVSSRWVDPSEHGDGVAQRCGRSTPAIFTSGHESDHLLRSPPGKTFLEFVCTFTNGFLFGDVGRDWSSADAFLLHHNIQSPGYGLSSRPNDTQTGRLNVNSNVTWDNILKQTMEGLWISLYATLKPALKFALTTEPMKTLRRRSRCCCRCGTERSQVILVKIFPMSGRH